LASLDSRASCAGEDSRAQ